jgi:hypothetical protein
MFLCCQCRDCCVTIVSAQVLPGLVFPPSCYITGDGLNLGSFLELPAALTAVAPELGSTLDFITREVPDRMEITVVTADVWGNQVAAGGAIIQAELYKFTDKAPLPDVVDSSSDSDSDAADRAASDSLSSESGTQASTSSPPPASTDGVVLHVEPVLDWYPVGPMANVKVVDNRNGSYTVAYTVHTSGRYKLEVSPGVSIC